MPIYEYRRPDGTTFETQQSFSDDALTVDPDSGVPVERVLHAPAVHFKGKGFYNTDYGTRNRQRETAAAAADKSSGEKSSSEKDSGGEKSSSGESSGAKSSAEGASSSSSSEGKSDKAATKSGDSKPVAAKS
ncbi:MAG TPA: zinc ribbon domain-containing protein [Solirubrobacteraceae bacterium]|jgi:putative FmdB family regulatory protein|nr:zinc ribbon domain-containing protein [Solirubrobacteraceae bacterium]